jgi:hypothetical protein
MSDPVLLVAVLKVVLLLVMIAALVIIFREIVPMARGRATPPAQQLPREDT